MTRKQFEKVKIGDTITSFGGGELIYKDGMNIILRQSSYTGEDRFLVTSLIEKRGFICIDYDVAQYCSTLKSAMTVIKELKDI